MMRTEPKAVVLIVRRFAFLHNHLDNTMEMQYQNLDALLVESLA